ncbi:hypothetical protein DBA20_02420 [Pandoraea capi]|nr:hypothetical protein [Pandoraea sp. LA3]MDN4581843.1 hypothetical protein [Pandoraea capi]
MPVFTDFGRRPSRHTPAVTLPPAAAVDAVDAVNVVNVVDADADADADAARIMRASNRHQAFR